MQVSTSTVRARPTPRPSCTPCRRREDAVQSELFDGYESRGGLASADELIDLMRPHWRQPVPVLTRWILGHKVLRFTVRTQALLPLFQFEQPRIMPRAGIADAAGEIADLMSEEDLAAWFLRPCEWLSHASPADVVATAPDLVVSAARRMRQAMLAHRYAN